jgi:hypothetical protein
MPETDPNDLVTSAVLGEAVDAILEDMGKMVERLRGEMNSSKKAI